MTHSDYVSRFRKAKKISTLDSLKQVLLDRHGDEPMGELNIGTAYEQRAREIREMLNGAPDFAEGLRQAQTRAHLDIPDALVKQLEAISRKYGEPKPC